MTTLSPRKTANRQIIDLIKWGEDYFQQTDIENPRQEMEWLVSDLLSCSRMELYVNTKTEVSAIQLKTLKVWMQRRLAGEPLQYITGKTEFFGLPFHIDANVLIPRPETERLVEVAIDIAQCGNAENIIDVGTGSGCVAVALAVKLPSAKIIAIDNSEDTLELARKNANSNGVSEQIKFLQLDILSKELDDNFDLMISNPPYIPPNELSTLSKGIRDHEPMQALTDRNDGLTFYRRFAEKGRDWISKGGQIILEVGRNKHPQKVKQIFSNAGYVNLNMFKDYNGDDRVLAIEV